MSLESVTAGVADHPPELRLIEAHASTATVADAAETLGGGPGRIAKTIALKVGERILQAFETVFPAAGSRNASLEICPASLAEVTRAEWVDCCTLPR